MEKEKWKPVANYVGKYEVSNLGRVKRLKEDVVRSNGKNMIICEKILSANNDDGYLVVSLSKHGYGKRFYVHVLVAKAFIENPKGKPFVNHVDGNRGNPIAENLEWVTQSENMKHSINMMPTHEEKEKKRTEIPAGEKEIWKDIKGFENLYEVSNFGMVRRLEGILEDRLGRKRMVPERMLKLRKTSKGKYMVELCKDNKSKFSYIHRLVAEAFLPNPNNKSFVSHIDGYVDNNSAFNLKWETYTEISKLKKFSKYVVGAPEISITGEELWRDIEGFETYYQVSNFGRVRSLNREIVKKRGGIIELKGRFMNIKLKKGYSIVRLSKNGKRQNVFMHRLVAQAFISNPNNKPIVNHINNIKHDNRVENLEWATHKENTQHMTIQFRGTAKAVKQYDLQGKFIKEYPSVANASKETGINYLTLIDMFKRKKQMCAGYQWKWANDDSEVTLYKDPSEKVVNQYTLSGEFLQTFPSILAAAEHLQALGMEKACGSSISKACIGKQDYAYGFQWRHNGDERPILNLKKRINRIVQLKMNGQFIKIHDHIRAAEKDLGINLNTSGISKCCNGRQKSAHGYIWLKEDNYINWIKQKNLFQHPSI
jgi:NUMOD4 motif/HNH endonuclease/NUMOD1 domain